MGCNFSEPDDKGSKPTNQGSSGANGNNQAGQASTNMVRGDGKFCVPTGKPTKKINITPKRAVGVNTAGDDDAFKICIVGAGESGKTTFSRNLLLNYLGGMDQKERKAEIVTIRGNMIDAIKDLVKFVESQGMSSQLPEELEEFTQELLDMDAFDTDFSEVATNLKELWRCDVIQQAYASPEQVVVPDNMEYFFEKISEIAKPDYMPTDGDLLRVRIRTIGIRPMVFDLEGARFQLTDVGGQLCERKNWQAVLDGTEAIMFAFSLAEFDRRMFEKPDELRIQDSLNLFEATVNGSSCNQCPVYLICNKFDKFSERVKKSDAFGAAFPDFGGNIHDPVAASQYLVKMFQDKMQNIEGTHTFQAYNMSAIDAQSVIKVAEAVFEDLNRRFFCD